MRVPKGAGNSVPWDPEQPAQLCWAFWLLMLVTLIFLSST
ncbi:hypothetical protein O5629_27825, partial [Escherichia coli]|nr:hypothetical protein [Escherichia coli]